MWLRNNITSSRLSSEILPTIHAKEVDILIQMTYYK